VKCLGKLVQKKEKNLFNIRYAIGASCGYLSEPLGRIANALFPYEKYKSHM
jgi:hypothetical protein